MWPRDGDEGKQPLDEKRVGETTFLEGPATESNQSTLSFVSTPHISKALN